MRKSKTSQYKTVIAIENKLMEKWDKILQYFIGAVVWLIVNSQYAVQFSKVKSIDLSILVLVFFGAVLVIRLIS